MLVWLEGCVVRPEQALARALHKQWDPIRAVVLADWCEERQLFGVAKALRKGPSANTRAKVEALYSCLSVKQVGSVRVFWKLDWLPNYQVIYMDSDSIITEGGQ